MTDGTDSLSIIIYSSVVRLFLAVSVEVVSEELSLITSVVVCITNGNTRYNFLYLKNIY